MLLDLIKPFYDTLSTVRVTGKSYNKYMRIPNFGFAKGKLLEVQNGSAVGGLGFEK